MTEKQESDIMYTSNEISEVMNMTQYLYEMTHYAKNAEMTLKVNDVRFLIDTLQATVKLGDHVEVIDGFTGELLCAQNCDNPYIQEEFNLMVLGRLMEKTWKNG